MRDFQSWQYPSPAGFGSNRKYEKKKDRSCFTWFFFLFIGLLFNFISKAVAHHSPLSPAPLTVLTLPCAWPGWPFTFIIFRMAECKLVPCGEQAGIQEHEHSCQENLLSLDSNPCYTSGPCVAMGRSLHFSRSLLSSL